MASKSAQNGSVAQVETAENVVEQVMAQVEEAKTTTSKVEEVKAAVPEMKFAISIKTKSERATSQLRDGLRILHWQEFKTEHKAIVGKGKEFADYLELYAVFDNLWKESDIQKLDLAGIEAFIKQLGYTNPEINKIRGDYYESKRGYQVTAAVSPMIAEIAESDVIPY